MCFILIHFVQMLPLSQCLLVFGSIWYVEYWKALEEIRTWAQCGLMRNCLTLDRGLKI